MVKKFVLGGSIWGGPRGGGTPKLCQNICLSNIYWYQKKTGTLAWAVQKFDFLGPHFGGVSGGVVPPNHVKIFLSLNIYWYQRKMAP